MRLGCACVLERSRLRALHCFLARAPELAPAASARIGALAGGPGVRALAHAREILSYGSRVPGEAGWNRTLAHIEGVFARLGGGWALERDCFTAQTPLGARPMCNLVASFRPEAGPCLLDLAAHFESKFFADAEFPAATDSAAPVGMLLELAEALSGALAAAADAPCLRLLFLDGEEAFVAWSESDSLYGARHLAAAWEAAPDPHRPGRRRLESMTTLVLLDLLGYRHPRLTWHFAETRPLFARLQGAESRLRAAGLLDSSAERNPQAPPPLPPSLLLPLPVSLLCTPSLPHCVQPSGVLELGRARAARGNQRRPRALPAARGAGASSHPETVPRVLAHPARRRRGAAPALHRRPRPRPPRRPCRALPPRLAQL